MKIPLTIILASLVGQIVAKAQVPDFAHPPVPNMYSTWAGQPPYQRNIYLDFSIDPVSGLDPNGMPGAVYAGTQDFLLRNADNVTISGAMRYFSAAQSPNGIAGIGIWNTTGETITGAATFAIGMPEGLSENFWAEVVLESATTNNTPAFELHGIEGYAASAIIAFHSFHVVVPGSPELGVVMSLDYGATITPMPSASGLGIDGQVAPGGYLILNSLHIAAESVPEPSSFGLLAAGALVFLPACRRARDKLGLQSFLYSSDTAQ